MFMDLIIACCKPILGQRLLAFLPELILCGAIVCCCCCACSAASTAGTSAGGPGAATSVAACVSRRLTCGLDRPAHGRLADVFSGLLVYDHFTVFLRLVPARLRRSS